MAKKKTDTDIVKVKASYEQLPDETVNYDLKNADIESLIRTIRGQKVMVDFDLSMLYGVKTKRLNEQVRRNTKRFPDDFMFQLTKEEWNILRSQFATTKDIYPPINFVQLPRKNHDRFLIIDDKVFFMGASLKDMGAGLCAVTEMHASPETVLGLLK